MRGTIGSRLIEADKYREWTIDLFNRWGRLIMEDIRSEQIYNIKY